MSKDSDFSEMSVVHGFPPEVIWIRRGNCTTREIEAMLRSEHESVEELEKSESLGILLLK